MTQIAPVPTLSVRSAAPQPAGFPSNPGAEFTLTETMRPGESCADMFRRLDRRLAVREGRMLGLFLYGSLEHETEIAAALREGLGAADWPVTWIEGASCEDRPVAGVQVFALGGRPVERIRVGGRVVGSVFEDGEARHCVLGGLEPVALTLAPAAQLQQMFANMELALELAGFALADVVRTWFYNDDILGWYPEFNRVRSALYAGTSWRTGSLPASTGIGARNRRRAATTLALRAVRPLAAEGRAGAREVASPLQCPAPAYGSAFSRAMELVSGGVSRLLVSGTASIHPDGRTAWAGDPRRQVDLTMEVVAAILRSRGLAFGDVTRATAYHRHAADAVHFAAWRAERGLGSLPVVDTHSVVCRPDLLFEIEIDAERASV